MCKYTPVIQACVCPLKKLGQTEQFRSSDKVKPLINDVMDQQWMSACNCKHDLVQKETQTLVHLLDQEFT